MSVENLYSNWCNACWKAELLRGLLFLQTVGESLLFALESGLGELFTPEAREAWTQLYAVVVGAMSRGWNREQQSE